TDIKAVIPEDICKEAGYHTAETVIINRPSCVFAGGTGTKVFTANKDFSPISRIVQNEVALGGIVRIVSPIAKQVIAESYTLGGFQTPCGDDLIGIYVFDG